MTAYGPLVISLPRRKLRVREITPMCLRDQNRRIWPAATSTAHVVVSGHACDNGGARSRGSAGTIGSQDRWRNVHAPACGSMASLASAVDDASESPIRITVLIEDERMLNAPGGPDGPGGRQLYGV